MLTCALIVPQDSSGMSCPKGLKSTSFDVGVIVVVSVESTWRIHIRQQRCCVASLDVKFLQSPGLDICKSPDNRWDLAYGGALVIDGLPMGYVSPGPLRPYLLEIKGVFYREGESFFHIEIKNHTA